MWGCAAAADLGGRAEPAAARAGRGPLHGRPHQLRTAPREVGATLQLTLLCLKTTLLKVLSPPPLVLSSLASPSPLLPFAACASAACWPSARTSSGPVRLPCRAAGPTPRSSPASIRRRPSSTTTTTAASTTSGSTSCSSTSVRASPGTQVLAKLTRTPLGLDALVLTNHPYHHM